MGVSSHKNKMIVHNILSLFIIFIIKSTNAYSECSPYPECLDPNYPECLETEEGCDPGNQDEVEVEVETPPNYAMILVPVVLILIGIFLIWCIKHYHYTGCKKTVCKTVKGNSESTTTTSTTTTTTTSTSNSETSNTLEPIMAKTPITEPEAERESSFIHSFTPITDSPNRTETWESYFMRDMCGQGDQELICFWCLCYTVEGLKRRVEEKGYSAFTIGLFPYAAMKKFDYQLKKEHLGCTPFYIGTIYVYTPTGAIKEV